MLNAINRFREQNGIKPISYTDRLVDDYCTLHCLEMAKRHDIYHAPSHYLDGWAEAVAMMQYCDNWKDEVIFKILGASDGHRDILLNSDSISYASYMDNWIVYVTIRGRRR